MAVSPDALAGALALIPACAVQMGGDGFVDYPKMSMKLAPACSISNGALSDFGYDKTAELAPDVYVRCHEKLLSLKQARLDRPST